MVKRAGMKLQQVYSRSFQSAVEAVRFVGSGEAVGDVEALAPCPLLMLSLPDSAIADIASRLAVSDIVVPGTIVFHCSGALCAEELHELRNRGALVASAHPIRSFADPSLAIRMFEGTYIALEGDSLACEVLHVLFARIGGAILQMTPHAKMLCHIGHVCASNYLVAILDLAQQLYRRAGIDDSVSTNFLRPIVHGTVENVLSLGTTKALTGPIMRGDVATVQRHSDVLSRELPQRSQIYAAIGALVLEIATRGGLSEAQSDAVHSVLQHMMGGNE
jgi:predicted short-subunit dehydrogenase-like oxidoreductase (DUF2520 family)